MFMHAEGKVCNVALKKQVNYYDFYSPVGLQPAGK